MLLKLIGNFVTLLDKFLSLEVHLMFFPKTAIFKETT